MRRRSRCKRQMTLPMKGAVPGTAPLERKQELLSALADLLLGAAAAKWSTRDGAEEVINELEDHR
jgi:hypothetical protein